MKNAAEAVMRTVSGTRGIAFFTTPVPGTGPRLFMFATLIGLISFGFPIGVTPILALPAPAMMELITRRARGREILARRGEAKGVLT